MTVLESLCAAVRAAGTYNAAAEVAPGCILWTDGTGEFRDVADRLAGALPEMLTLGDYAPGKRQGPAVWLRCAMAGTVEVPGFRVEEGRVPILYLPGVARGAFREVGRMDQETAPLAYWAFRGCFFGQRNGKDWTREAFLQSADNGGLGLDLARDAGSSSALAAAFGQVLDLDPEVLRGRRLGRDDWNALVAGEDFPRDMLLWLSGADAWRNERDAAEWRAFRELSKSRYGLDPDRDGRDAALARLADRQGAWGALFRRYGEAWAAFPGILPGLKALPRPEFGLLDTADTRGGWPQWNEGEEKLLCGDLGALAGRPAAEAARRLEQLEKRHGARRALPWARMGLSPLANALEGVSHLAAETARGIPAACTAEDLAEWHEREGWKADAAALDALAAAAGHSEAERAVQAAVRTLLKPWMEQSALGFQRLAGGKYEGEDCGFRAEAGTLFLFADGLRLDVAERVAEALEKNGFTVGRRYRWAPLPSVTEVGKPAALPEKPADRVGEGDGDAYGAGNAAKKRFEKLRAAHGLVAADGENGGTASVPAGETARWREFGDNLDEAGHAYGANLARRLDGAVAELAKETERAFEEGSRRVCIVTDHGWLLLPGELPKAEFPGVLAEERHGRWGRPKEGAGLPGGVFEQRAESGETLCFAPGICCFRAGMDYTHGGMSLQECRLLELEVTRGGSVAGAVAIQEVIWKQLRLRGTVSGAAAGCRVDLRSDPRRDGSLLKQAGALGEDGRFSVIVADEDLFGQEAFLVVLGPDGTILSQRKVHVGG